MKRKTTTYSAKHNPEPDNNFTTYNQFIQSSKLKEILISIKSN